MSRNIVICEDEEEILNKVSEEIADAFLRVGVKVSIHGFTDPEKCLHAVYDIPFSICFLDIDMGVMNGIQLAEQFRIIKKDLLIVFISNMEEQVYSSLRVQPLRFIRKYRIKEEIDEAVRAILQHEKEEKILLNINGKKIVLPLSQILYIESLGKKQIVHGKQKDYEVNVRLSDLDEALMDKGFLRIHKSILVNYRYIFSIESTEVILDNQTRLPISKHRVVQIRRQFRELMENTASII